MGCKIYSVSGTFPSLAKNVLLYTFENEPETIKEGIKKNLELDDVLGNSFKEAADTYALDKSLTITGKFGTGASQTIAVRMQNLEKLQSYYAIATAYPTGGQFDSNSANEQIYAFEYDIPNSGTRTFFGLITGLDFDVKTTYVDYTVNIIGCELVYII